MFEHRRKGGMLLLFFIVLDTYVTTMSSINIFDLDYEYNMYEYDQPTYNRATCY